MPRPELAVGIGLRPGTTADAILVAIRNAVGDREIRCLATVERRVGEPGIRAAADRLGVELVGFTLTELEAVSVPNPSERVALAVGSASVAEAAAVLAGGSGNLVIAKTVFAGVVIAAAEFNSSSQI
ncbi:cobalamin biosynthesis protein [Nocardia sp. NPDC059239]|uniref:cobalamin biosynthesis protein n=1 Tax=unclassified Nocardia TaxID=2637762 RepID=UPI00367E6AAA